jgi:UDP-N-acetylglucosamine 2-epimerase
MSFKILSVVGARSNFMKVAAICEAVKQINCLKGVEQIHHVLVHTGQHYDSNMSDSFFNDLELPKPDLCLGHGTNVLVGSDPEKIIKEFNRLSPSGHKLNWSPRYWDGNAAKRITKVLVDDFCAGRSLVVDSERLLQS